jgi:hypothetical protein
MFMLPIYSTTNPLYEVLVVAFRRKKMELKNMEDG